MAQCHGYFPLTYPHFLLLAAFWSQGCIRSSTWEGVVHTEFETDSREDQALFLCREGNRAVPEMGQGSWCQAQQAPRAATSKDRYYSGTAPARARRQGTQLSAGVGEEHYK